MLMYLLVSKETCFSFSIVSIEESVTMQELRREDVVTKLYSRLEVICSDISEIKSMIQEIELPSRKTLESKEAKIHTMPNVV